MSVDQKTLEERSNNKHPQVYFLDKTQEASALEKIRQVLNTFVQAQEWFDDPVDNKFLQKLLSKELEIQILKQISESQKCRLCLPELEAKLEDPASKLNRLLKFLVVLHNHKQIEETSIGEIAQQLKNAENFLSDLEKKSNELNAKLNSISFQFAEKENQRSELLQQIQKQNSQVTEQNGFIKKKSEKLDAKKGITSLILLSGLLFAEDFLQESRFDVLDGFLKKVNLKEAQRPLLQALKLKFDLAEGEGSKAKLVIGKMQKKCRLKFVFLLGALLSLAPEMLGCKPEVGEKIESDQIFSSYPEEPADVKFNFIQNLTLIALKAGINSSEVDSFINHIGVMTHLAKPKIDPKKNNLEFAGQYCHFLEFPANVVLNEEEKMILEISLDDKILDLVSYRKRFFTTNFTLTQAEFEKIKIKYNFIVPLPNGKEIIINGDFKNKLDLITNSSPLDEKK